uniref:Uncharacterized protein n=1 Tax=Hyaloperonospora arabidopsidis (strain Emoy2) TaxID=559515 RepID=M4BLR5_HYAAE
MALCLHNQSTEFHVNGWIEKQFNNNSILHLFRPRNGRIDSGPPTRNGRSTPNTTLYPKFVNWSQ